MLYLIIRSFTCLANEIFVPLSSALARINLQYAFRTYFPYLKKVINHQERIYRATTRDLTFEERLQTLKLQLLGKSRPKNYLELTHKMLYNHINLEATQLFNFWSRPGLRRSSIRLLHQTGRTRRRRISFACRGVNNWNRLPISAVSVTRQRKLKKTNTFTYLLTVFPFIPFSSHYDLKYIHIYINLI